AQKIGLCEVQSEWQYKGLLAYLAYAVGFGSLSAVSIPLSKTSLPPIIVKIGKISFISSSGQLRISADRTTISASLSLSIDPLMSSSKEAWALLMVYILSAS